LGYLKYLWGGFTAFPIYTTLHKGEIKKMKIKKLLELDCRIDGNLALIEEKASELPFFSKGLNTEKLEKALWKIDKKHNIKINFLMFPSIRYEQGHYTFYITNIKNGNSNPIKVIYAISIYEGLLKSILYMYAYIKKARHNKDGE